jgi:hypothetical protein
MLFQNSESINGGQQMLTNMTNDAITSTAVEAIAEKLLDNEYITRVSLVCTHSADDAKDTIFQVWDTEGGYLFSVDNEGNTFEE